MRKRKSSLLSIVVLVLLIGQIICPIALGADDYGLDSPNGGDVLKVGSDYTIKWHLNNPMIKQMIGIQGGVGAYRIEYSTDSGGTYQLIKELSDIDATSYNWTVPNTTTTQGRVKVTLISIIKIPPFGQIQVQTVATDYSDNNFTISNSLIPILPKPKFPILISPTAPSNLAATVSDQKIELSWLDNANNETQFKLERSTNTNSSYAEIASLGPDTTSYTDTNVSAFTKYYYRIKAMNNIGSSDYSNEVSVTTPPLAKPPQPPQQTVPQKVIVFYLNSTDYLIDKQLQTMDVSPVSIDGRTMLPVKYVANPLGATTAWDPATQKVTVTSGSTVIELWVGKNTARVNGQEKLIDPNNPSVKPIILPPGRTMMPLRFIGENLGCQVDWNPPLQEAKLTYPKVPN